MVGVTVNRFESISCSALALVLDLQNSKRVQVQAKTSEF